MRQVRMFQEDTLMSKGENQATRQLAISLSVIMFGLLVTGNTVFAQNSVEQAFIRGQNVQPAYEGWDRNPDGSYNLYFGYLNRNLRE